MANFLQEILIWKEATPSVIPTSPTCYGLKAESFGIATPQDSETNNELGGGRGASAKSFGAVNVSGDIGMIWNSDNAPILFTHAIGAATSTANATSDTWSATTVVTKGDLINHSDGVHTLACYVGGTTGSSEPDLAAYATGPEGRGIRVTDGTATWIIMPLLVEQSGVRSDCLESFGLETRHDDTCGVSSPQYCRYTGMYINTLPLSISGTMKALKSSAGTIGMAEEDSLLVTAYEAMSAKSGYTNTELISDYFLLGECTAYLDGTPISLKVTTFDGTINNSVSMDDALNSLKVDNVGIVSVDGSIKMILDTTMYADAAAHSDKDFKFTFQKDNGCLMEIQFPQAKLEKTYKESLTDKTTMLTIPWSAFDTSSEYSVRWRTISPTSY